MIISRRKLITRAAAAVAAPYGFVAPVRKLFVPPAHAFMRGGLAVASSIPSGFPTADSTGVPAGTVLTNQTSRVTTTSNGQAFNAVNFQQGLVILHSGVTVTDCLLQSPNSSACVDMDGTVAVGPVLTRCTLNPGNNGGKSIVWGTGKMLACQIVHSPDGVELTPGDTQQICKNVLIQDCFIVFTAEDGAGGEHPDCIEGDGGHSNVTINHTTVLNQANNNSCLTCLTNPWGPISDMAITDNFMVGGNYTMYYGQNNPSFPFTNLTVTGNHVGFGNFGYATVSPISGTFTVSGNVDATTGANIDDQMTNGG